MEYFPDGSILETFKKGQTYSFKKKVNAMRQMSAGLLHLHRVGIIHGDVAARNMLIDLRLFRVAITDFGLAKRVKDCSKSKTIAPRWSSPRLCKTRVSTVQSDIYALGITFIEVLRDGEIPFVNLKNAEVVARICEGLVPEILPAWGDPLGATLRGCFTDVAGRWSAKRVNRSLRELQETLERQTMTLFE